jgi:hypothetical protein
MWGAAPVANPYASRRSRLRASLQRTSTRASNREPAGGAGGALSRSASGLPGPGPGGLARAPSGLARAQGSAALPRSLSVRWDTAGSNLGPQLAGGEEGAVSEAKGKAGACGGAASRTQILVATESAMAAHLQAQLAALETPEQK